MRTVLLSNIPHYHYLAEALFKADLLKLYLSAITLVDDDTAPGWLSAYWNRKLEGRRLHHVPGSAVRQIRVPEILQRLLPMVGVLSPERANWMNNHLFDKLAERHVGDCDVLHFVSSVGLYSARQAKRRGASLICDIRQEHPQFQRNILADESRRFGVPVAVPGTTYEQKVLDELSLADYVVVPSKHAGRTFLQAGFPADRLITIPYGVDLANFGPPQKRASTFRVLYAGSITLRKGVQYLLEAFSRLKLPKAELILAGPLDPAMKPVLAKYEGSFEYRAAVPKLELRKLYGESAAFVLPSLADSFSLATLEAMACHTPVIVSDNTGAADCIEHGKNGFVVPIRDPGAIASILEQLYSEHDLREKIGRQAGHTARQFNWQRYGRLSVEAYRQLFTMPEPQAISAPHV